MGMSHKLNIKTIKREKMKHSISHQSIRSLIKIFYINEGEILLVYTLDNSFLEIRDCNSFKLIKKINLEKDDVSDAVLYSNNEILFCDEKYKIIYIKFDDNYKIVTYYSKVIKNVTKDEFLFLGLKKIKKLENRKFVLITNNNIFFLKLNKNKNIFLEVILVYYKVQFWKEIKKRNEYIISFKNSEFSVINSKNNKIKKKFKTSDNNFMSEEFSIINDNYFCIKKIIEMKLILYNLETFKKIKTFSFKNNFYIHPIENNIFFTYEIKEIKTYEQSKIIKMWKFDEKNIELKLCGYFDFLKLINVERKDGLLPKFSKIITLNMKDNLFCILYTNMVDYNFIIAKITY